MDQWKVRSAWLLNGFTSSSKNMKASLEDFLHFANGNTCSSVITHWCLTSQGPGKPPCCQSDDEARCKLLSHLIPFMGRGYQTPLLYRMKHYAPASSFIKVGTCCFNILPRVLAEMDEHVSSNHPEDASLIDSLLGSSEAKPFSAESDLQHMLADALDCDQNYAAQNGLRRKLVSKEFAKDGFFKSAMIVDSLIQPLEYAINFMMGHTKILHDLCFLGKGHPESVKLQNKSKEKFMKVVGGSLADSVIQKYITFLDVGLLHEVTMGLQPSSQQLNKIFTILLVCISDSYRRFKLDFQAPPYKTFGLLNCSTTQEFVNMFSALEAKLKCSHCVDVGLTAPLLRQFPNLSSQTLEEQEAAQVEVQEILGDLSCWTPTTSDVVELKNGQVQWSVSRRSGYSTKGIPAAMGTTLIQSAVKQNHWVQESVGLATLPEKVVSSSVLKTVGTKSSNQYSSIASRFCLHQHFFD